MKETLMVNTEGEGHYFVVESAKTISFRRWSGDPTWSIPGKELLLLDKTNFNILKDETDLFSMWVFYKYMERYYGEDNWVGQYKFFRMESE